MRYVTFDDSAKQSEIECERETERLSRWTVNQRVYYTTTVNFSQNNKIMVRDIDYEIEYYV